MITFLLNRTDPVFSLRIFLQTNNVPGPAESQYLYSDIIHPNKS